MFLFFFVFLGALRCSVSLTSSYCILPVYICFEEFVCMSVSVEFLVAFFLLSRRKEGDLKKVKTLVGYDVLVSERE